MIRNNGCPSLLHISLLSIGAWPVFGVVWVVSDTVGQFEDILSHCWEQYIEPLDCITPSNTRQATD